MSEFHPIIPSDPSHDSSPKLVSPWLVAAWPGMGGVGAIAATRLAQSLDAKPFAMIPEREFFPVEYVEVQSGIARTGRLPRSMFFLWRDPEKRHDLLIFIGEAQPPTNGFGLCQRIMEIAAAQGVERVVTFAAMATGIHPTGDPSVYGAVTSPELLATMREEGIELLQHGAITGLNGSLLAAANDRNIPGLCLLGEMPYFAAGAPNPKSSKAALEAFGRLVGVEFDLSLLGREAEAMEPQLTSMLEQMEKQAQLTGEGEEAEEADDDMQGEHEEGDSATPVGGSESASDDAPPAATPPPTSTPKAPRESDEPTARVRRRMPDPSDRQRIEELFTAAERDRAQTMNLKAELDRLGLFQEFEDRFLDLFRKGGS